MSILDELARTGWAIGGFLLLALLVAGAVVLVALLTGVLGWFTHGLGLEIALVYGAVIVYGLATK